MSGINEDVLVINFDRVLKYDTIESYIKFEDAESRFQIWKRDAIYQYEDLNLSAEDRNIVKIDNLTALKTESHVALYASVQLGVRE
jgi:hypothetical protein